MDSGVESDLDAVKTGSTQAKADQNKHRCVPRTGAVPHNRADEHASALIGPAISHQAQERPQSTVYIETTARAASNTAFGDIAPVLGGVSTLHDVPQTLADRCVIAGISRP